jgi:2-C-methyl-D-erythritol 2,4-cyclodiphosphate synthase
MLGGVQIPYARGLIGHSDADVLLHAIADALLGACALPDIGVLFPDTDEALRDADSAELLKKICHRVRARGFALVNIDCVVVGDAPRLAPHAGAIRRRVAELIGIPVGAVGFKAKTTEGTGLAVTNRSIAALANVLVERRR